MEWQLRMYRAKEGALDAFADEWHEHVLPLRRSRGFEVLGPWIAEAVVATLDPRGSM